MKVSVSILGSYNRLVYAVNKVNNSSADYLHIDVMDGIFVEDTKFPIEVVKDIKSISKKPLDVHLMVDSEDMIRKYAKEVMPEYLTFHIEVMEDYSLIDYIKSLGIKVGIAINPDTDIQSIMPYVDDIDLLLFMSVVPGKGGQKLNEEVIQHIIDVKKAISKDVIISIDGGVNNKTVELCKYAGGDMVVSGSYITNSDNYEDKIKELR